MPSNDAGAKGEVVRELWGVEFPVVSEGLAEDQVVSFVNKLYEVQRGWER